MLVANQNVELMTITVILNRRITSVTLETVQITGLCADDRTVIDITLVSLETLPSPRRLLLACQAAEG